MARRNRQAPQTPPKPSAGPKDARPGLSPSQGLIAAARPLGLKDWYLAAALVVAVFVVYQPAWQGGLVWDDDAHVTRPDLRSLDGLYRIWFDIGATQQYYPLLHSAFWLEHKLWGDATLGYHLVNILLHAVAALMVAIILRRLAVPGAYLAAAIFALHPVAVESVAWITELKNTLSAVFYLGAMLVYLRFDETRKRSLWAGALALFVLGLLSKTVTATLPAALLVIFWWQRGRLSWRRDVLPLLPFFVLGAAAGWCTAWVEQNLIGAKGAEFDLTIIQSCLIGGRAIWFYLGKLLWPGELIFFYPRWQIDQTDWRQYAFPTAAVALLAACWAVRRRWRGPLAGLLFFAGTLFPVLGFFNVYPFLFSFVADHFQYLASLGVITLVAAGIALVLDRWRLWGRAEGHALCLALLAVLAGLTEQQSRMYTDLKMLYQRTIDRNPGCWMAHCNLGLVLAARGRIDDAINEYRKALAIKADDELAHNGLGFALMTKGQIDEAIYHFRRALAIKDGFAEAHNNLGNALAARGQTEEAIVEYRRAADLNPSLVLAHYNLGNTLAARGQTAEAIAEYRETLKINPDFADAHYGIGNVLRGLGRIDEAIGEYQTAVRINPGFAVAHNNLGAALLAQGRVDEAVEHYRKAVQSDPRNDAMRRNLGIALARQEERQRSASPAPPSPE